jgi:probable H4MPT-linked C1 transfer pathway protein
MKTTLDHTSVARALLPVIGWDVGGAHLKAVRIDAVGRLAVSQIYCPLWRGLDALSAAIDQALTEFSVSAMGHAHCVTMTGELADIFPNRVAGVRQIAGLLSEKLSEPMLFYAGYQHWLSLPEVASQTHRIASMNWMASIEYLASHVRHALFVDIGSTTTDLALICNGEPKIMGFSDATRMQTNELIYTGVVRTPLMALAQKIAFQGQSINLAAEHFATTADVYSLTGDLPMSEYSAETADGADKGLEGCARRLARMIGRDADDASLADWQALAQAFKLLQLQQLQLAIEQHLAALTDKAQCVLIGAGVGDFLLAGLAKRLNMAYSSVKDFMPLAQQGSGSAQRMAAVCFPAYAVASLGRGHA